MKWDKYPTLYNILKEWEPLAGFIVNEEFEDPGSGYHTGNYDMDQLEALARTCTHEELNMIMGDENMDYHIVHGRPELHPLVEWAASILMEYEGGSDCVTTFAELKNREAI